MGIIARGTLLPTCINRGIYHKDLGGSKNQKKSKLPNLWEDWKQHSSGDQVNHYQNSSASNIFLLGGISALHILIPRVLEKGSERHGVDYMLPVNGVWQMIAPQQIVVESVNK